MQKILACALVVILFSKAVLSNRNTSDVPSAISQQSWLTYTDSSQNITVQYPDNWSLNPTTGKALFVIKSPAEDQPDSFIENINLIVRAMPAENGKLDFKSLKDGVIQQLTASMDSFKLVYAKDIKWKTENGYEMSFTAFDKGSGLHLVITQRYLYNHGRLFVCTYTAQGLKQDIYKSTATAIMNKISW